MSREELDKSWLYNFGDVLPAADQLKWEVEERWCRIHSLPNSKRYADSEDEYKEIFYRHNSILDGLIGERSNYFLLTQSLSAKLNRPTRDRQLKKLGLQVNYWRSFEINDDPLFYSHYYYDEQIWRAGFADDLFRLVADDEVRGVMFFSNEKNILYHPYDGGGDIIAPDAKTKTIYKHTYKRWLSNHAGGF